MWKAEVKVRGDAGRMPTAERLWGPPVHGSDTPLLLLLRASLRCEICSAVRGQGTCPVRLERTRAQLCRGRKFAPGHTKVTARERIQSSRVTAHVLARVTDATKSPLTLLDTNVVDGLSRMAQRGAGPCGLPIQVSGANDVIALLGRFWEPHDFASKVLSDNDPDD